MRVHSAVHRQVLFRTLRMRSRTWLFFWIGVIVFGTSSSETLIGVGPMSCHHRTLYVEKQAYVQW